MQTILFIPTNGGIGLTSACLGFVRALDFLGIKAGFMTPFSQSSSDNTLSQSSVLMQNAFHLNPPASISRQHLERMLGNDQLDELMEEVVEQYQQIANKYDVIVCEGLVPSNDSTYAEQVNVAIAQALDAKVIFVSTGDLAQPNAIADKLDIYARDFGGLDSERTLGTILMRVKGIDEVHDVDFGGPGEALLGLTQDQLQQIHQHSPSFGTDQFHVLGMVPFSNSLSVPRTWDVANVLDATWLNEGEAKSRRVVETKLIGRSVANIEGAFNRGTLLVVAGDRDDIILATALATLNGVPLAGLVLTGDLMPNDNVVKLCRNALKSGIPIMSVKTDSFDTAQRLVNMSYEIPDDDTDRAIEVANYVAAHLDLEWMKAKFSNNSTNPRLSPSAFRYQLVKKAQNAKKRIVLPEGDEPRTVEAAVICQSRGKKQGQP